MFECGYMRDAGCSRIGAPSLAAGYDGAPVLTQIHGRLLDHTATS